MADEIINELWSIKDDIAREHGYDLEELVAKLRARARQPGNRGEETASMTEIAEQDAAPER